VNGNLKQIELASSTKPNANTLFSVMFAQFFVQYSSEIFLQQMLPFEIDVFPKQTAPV